MAKRAKHTRESLSLLLYLETCAVDHGGIVDGRRMNADDYSIAERWNKEGYVSFERLKFSKDAVSKGSTHVCALSDKAWVDVHTERRCRAERSKSDFAPEDPE
jgi:hypothetical protein